LPPLRSHDRDGDRLYGVLTCATRISYRFFTDGRAILSPSDAETGVANVREIVMEVLVATAFLAVLTLAGLARSRVLTPLPNAPMRRPAPVRRRI
jgi:hypothetical protein